LRRTNVLQGDGEPEFGELIKDLGYRTGFVLLAELDALKKALADFPELASIPLADGLSPVSSVLRRSKLEGRVDLLLTANPTLSFIEHAALGNFTAVVKALTGNQYIDEQQSDGTTALWCEMDVCKLLLKKGANVNKKAGTPLMSILAIAVITYNYDMAHLLLEHGADINAKGPMGEPLLHTAASCFLGMEKHNVNGKLIELLKKHGLTTDMVDPEGNTPLQVASKNHQRWLQGEHEQWQIENMEATMLIIEELLS